MVAVIDSMVRSYRMLKTIAWAILFVQIVSFVALGIYFLAATQHWRLGIAQLLLAAVQAIIYSGGLPDAHA